jgi:hypothetical protein
MRVGHTAMCISCKRAKAHIMLLSSISESNADPGSNKGVAVAMTVYMLIVQETLRLDGVVKEARTSLRVNYG